jgi:hypothetical protein
MSRFLVDSLYVHCIWKGNYSPLIVILLHLRRGTSKQGPIKSYPDYSIGGLFNQSSIASHSVDLLSGHRCGHRFR